MCSLSMVGTRLLCRVGVFVSIVSTKIPFKGAGKEYVGDDVEEMVSAVKQAIQQCGVQLKVGSLHVVVGWHGLWRIITSLM